MSFFPSLRLGSEPLKLGRETFEENDILLGLTNRGVEKLAIRRPGDPSQDDALRSPKSVKRRMGPPEVGRA